jgi:hypothetical protein
MREVKIKVVDVRNPTHRVEKKLEEIDETEYGNVTSSEKESQRQLGSDTTLEDDEPLAGEEVEIERTEGEEAKVPETLSRTTSMDGGKGPDESVYVTDGTLKGILGDVFDVWGSQDKDKEKIDDDEEDTIENLQKKLTNLKKNLNKAPPRPVAEMGVAIGEDVVRWLEDNIDPKIKTAIAQAKTSHRVDENDILEFRSKFRSMTALKAKELIGEYYLNIEDGRDYEITKPGLTIDWSKSDFVKPSSDDDFVKPSSDEPEIDTDIDDLLEYRPEAPDLEMQDLQKKLDILKANR